MIATILKDKELRYHLSRIARYLISLLLFCFVFVFVTNNQYDRACFDLLLAALVAPEIWLKNGRE